jgi:glycosyltransferase involved in cell wall biosynthesis
MGNVGVTKVKYYVVQALAYPLSPGRCAMESAFAQHLTTLRELLGTRCAELVLIAPAMTSEMYAAQASHLCVLDAEQTGVRFEPAYDVSISRVRFLLFKIIPVWLWLWEKVKEPCVVQSGISTQLAHPLMFMASLAARIRGWPVVFMVDIDFRQHAARFYRLGQWSFKSYLINRFIYDPMKWLQLWIAPRIFDLCLFKSDSLVRDFGRGRSNVRNFLDTAHDEAHLLDDEGLAARRQWIADSPAQLRVVYFGRLAVNKGIDCVIHAVKLAGSSGNLQLRIIGDGECLPALRQLAFDQGVSDRVEFIPAVPYGEPLFRLLADCHVCVAAPLIEDTPRAVIDAMALGLPVVAFDIRYFSDLAAAGAAVITTPWPEPSGLTKAFIQLAGDRPRLSALSVQARDFARANTQRIWVSRRIAWLREVMDDVRQ